jgi:sugar fermentation stimulation protein A
MRFSRPLVPGTLIRRYQRFLADVRLEDGSVITAVCPNTGSMRSCNEAGRPVLLSESDSPSRKYRLTWEMIRMGRSWVGIHTGHPNRVTHEAILAGRVPELAGYAEVRREVPYGRENSRIDLLLRNGDRRCYVEVKNVTQAVGGAVAAFPDAVTERGRKHLRELAAMARRGHRAVIFFFLGRSDCRRVRPADEIDPAYGVTLRKAVAAGVEPLAYRAVIRPGGITLGGRVPFEIPDRAPRMPKRRRRRHS